MPKLYIKWLPAHLDDNNCAQMRSSSSSSSGDWSDETCKGILSQGAPVSVARPSISEYLLFVQQAV